MQHWIFISSLKKFRMDDCLADNGFVEFHQKNNVMVNDIVYLYTTAPVCRIEYKMIVEKIDIPKDEWFDDSEYNMGEEPLLYDDEAKNVRLRLVKRVDNPNLHLDCLRDYGLKSSMQGNFKVSGELLDYIEEEFKCEDYKKTWKKMDIYHSWISDISIITHELEALKKSFERLEEDLKEEYMGLNPLEGPKNLETMKCIGNARYNAAKADASLKDMELYLEKTIQALEQAIEHN